MSTNTHNEIENVLREYQAVLSANDREFLKSLLSFSELTTEQVERLNTITEELLLPLIVIMSATATTESSIYEVNNG